MEAIVSIVVSVVRVLGFFFGVIFIYAMVISGIDEIRTPKEWSGLWEPGEISVEQSLEMLRESYERCPEDWILGRTDIRFVLEKNSDGHKLKAVRIRIPKAEAKQYVRWYDTLVREIREQEQRDLEAQFQQRQQEGAGM